MGFLDKRKGGAIDKGEYVVEAACREVMEEVGLKVYPVGFAGIWDELQSRFGCNSLYFCIVMSLTPPKNSCCNSQNEHEEEAEEEPALTLDPAEIVEARWVPLEEIVGKEEDKEVDEEGKKTSTRSQVGGYPFSTPLRHFVAGYLSAGTRESGRLLDNTSLTYGAMSGKGYFFLPS
ncbi:Nucleoside triphosphatase NudI, variant 2 [Balamuthia mandrillaris]